MSAIVGGEALCERVAIDPCRRVVVSVRCKYMNIEQERPLLLDVLPDLAHELRQLLTQDGREDLATGVTQVRVYDKCRCGDSSCSSVYAAPKPEGAWGKGHETIVLEPEKGMINVDLVDGKIVYVEVLDRPDVKEAVERSIQ